MSANFKEYTPEDKNQAIVQTPYGRGLVIRSGRKDGVQEIELTEWKLAPSSRSRRSSFPMLYSKQKYPSVKPMKGDDITCLWGRGRVSEIRKDGIVAVKLSSWRLAKRSLVSCYLKPSDVQVVRKKIQREMSVYERVEFAKECKLTATKQFSKKMYLAALNMYSKAIDAIRYVNHDAGSSNEIRGDLVMVMITCNNNAATCCRQLQKWDECIKFAKNALVLLDALYGKRGLKIHTILNADGFKDSKLFSEWRVKSYLLAARAHFEKQDYEEVMKDLDAASRISTKETMQTPTLVSQQKEIKTLKAYCIREQKAIKRKEKKRAQAMFGGSVLPEKSALPSREQSTNNNSKMQIPQNQSMKSKTLVSEKAKSPLSEDISTSEAHPAALSDTKDDAEDEEEELSFFGEHKEAIILGVILAGAGILSSTLFRNKR